MQLIRVCVCVCLSVCGAISSILCLCMCMFVCKQNFLLNISCGQLSSVVWCSNDRMKHLRPANKSHRGQERISLSKLYEMPLHVTITAKLIDCHLFIWLQKASDLVQVRRSSMKMMKFDEHFGLFWFASDEISWNISGTFRHCTHAAHYRC